jgi:hypothetical protein
VGKPVLAPTLKPFDVSAISVEPLIAVTLTFLVFGPCKLIDLRPCNTFFFSVESGCSLVSFGVVGVVGVGRLLSLLLSLLSLLPSSSDTNMASLWACKKVD